MGADTLTCTGDLSCEMAVTPAEVEPMPVAMPSLCGPAAFLSGWEDCAAEALRYLLEVEHLSEDDPVVVGLIHHIMDNYEKQLAVSHQEMEEPRAQECYSTQGPQCYNVQGQQQHYAVEGSQCYYNAQAPQGYNIAQSCVACCDIVNNNGGGCVDNHCQRLASLSDIPVAQNHHQNEPLDLSMCSKSRDSIETSSSSENRFRNLTHELEELTGDPTVLSELAQKQPEIMRLASEIAFLSNCDDGYFLDGEETLLEDMEM